jgi:hypothetical protein
MASYTDIIEKIATERPDLTMKEVMEVVGFSLWSFEKKENQETLEMTYENFERILREEMEIYFPFHGLAHSLGEWFPMDHDEVIPYSGRGMYGKQCVGFVVFNRPNLASLGDIPKAFGKPQSDNLGQQYVVYFPEVSPEENKEEVTQ